jgi:hypothetical protein
MSVTLPGNGEDGSLSSTHKSLRRIWIAVKSVCSLDKIQRNRDRKTFMQMNANVVYLCEDSDVFIPTIRNLS